MKRNYPLLIFIIACLSLLSGNLTAGVSLVGKLGISFFYKEYGFFKVWWQSALVCFALMLFVLGILFIIDKMMQDKNRRIVLLSFFFLFLLGLYFTFRDFRTDLAHRWLGERFHVGIYLYWIGFCIICGFFLFTKKHNRQIPVEDNWPVV